MCIRDSGQVMTLVGVRELGKLLWSEAITLCCNAIQVTASGAQTEHMSDDSFVFARTLESASSLLALTFRTGIVALETLNLATLGAHAVGLGEHASQLEIGLGIACRCLAQGHTLVALVCFEQRVDLAGDVLAKCPRAGAFAGREYQLGKISPPLEDLATAVSQLLVGDAETGAPPCPVEALLTVPG